MSASSRKAKLELRDELDAYVINFMRKTDKTPTCIPISDAEFGLIRDLIAEHMSNNENCDKYYYECSNNPELDTLLVWQGCDLYTTPTAKEQRDSIK